jgi:radical SAM protein with 4Fe4S-binding SPASM domain
LHLLGGEPLTHPDLHAILERLINKCITLTIYTNGLLINDDFINLVRNSHQSEIVVSLDGPDRDSHERLRGKSTFNPAIKNIAKLVNALRDTGNRVGISSTLYADTIFRIRDIIELARDLNVNALYLNRLIIYGNAAIRSEEIEVNADTYLVAIAEYFVKYGFSTKKDDGPCVFYSFLDTSLRAYLRKFIGIDIPIPYVACRAATTEGAIDSMGRLWPCTVFYANLELRQPLADYFGILDNSLIYKSVEDIWESEGFKNFRELKAQRLHQRFGNPCHKCGYAHLCSPCFLPYLVGGSFDRPDCLRLQPAVLRIDGPGATTSAPGCG